MKLNINPLQFTSKNIIFLLCILISVTPFLETIGKSSFYLILLLIIIRNSLDFNKKNLAILISFSFFLFLFPTYNDILYSINWKLNLLNFLFFFNIIVGFFLSQSLNKYDALFINEKLVTFFVIIGLPFHFILITQPNLVNFLLNYNYGDTAHKTLIILNAHISESGLYEGRFMSFAWEPGIMQMLLNLALFNRLKRFHNKLDLFSIIILISIFFTYSTAGYFICFLILLFTKQFFKPFFLFLLLILSPFIYQAISQAIQIQLTFKLSGSDSFAFRYDRLYLIFKNWDFLQLVFGRGSNYYDFVLKQQDLGGFDSFTNIIQRYGLVTFIFISSCLFVNNNKIVALIIFLTFLSQSIWYAPFVAFFYFKDNTLQSKKSLFC